MNVAIEARALSAPGAGVRLYVAQLLRALVQSFPEQTYTAIQTGHEPLPGLTSVTLPLRHELLLPWWLNRTVTRHLASYRYNVAHFTKAAVPRRKVAPTVVTIYDIIPLLYPAGQSPLRRRYWPRTLAHAALTSDHILTISEASRQDIIRQFDVAPEKVTATPLAAADHFVPETNPQRLAAVRARYRLTAPYLLFVGTLEPRKNVPALIRVFEALASEIPYDLVIAGRPSFGAPAIMRAAAASPVRERIHFLQQVAAPDLPALYTGAALLVWPSIYEGWGLPPLEALACGVPVIVSDGGSLPQVVGNAGRVVPFTRPAVADRLQDEAFEHAFGQAIIRQLSQSDTPGAKQARINHARTFSWAAVAEQTQRVYQQVAAL